LNAALLSLNSLSFLILMEFWGVIYRGLFVLFVGILNNSQMRQITKGL